MADLRLVKPWLTTATTIQFEVFDRSDDVFIEAIERDGNNFEERALWVLTLTKAKLCLISAFQESAEFEIAKSEAPEIFSCNKCVHPSMINLVLCFNLNANGLVLGIVPKQQICSKLWLLFYLVWCRFTSNYVRFLRWASSIRVSFQALLLVPGVIRN